MSPGGYFGGRSESVVMMVNLRCHCVTIVPLLLSVIIKYMTRTVHQMTENEVSGLYAQINPCRDCESELHRREQSGK